MDTNFINFSIQNKLDVVQSMMDCLYAKCVPCITDCVVAELEKLGSKFRVAQRLAGGEGGLARDVCGEIKFQILLTGLYM